MKRFTGKVAVVTGASSGIGAAIAEKLVREGVIVVGFARRKELIEELSEKLQTEKGKLYAVKVDVTNEKEVVEGFEFVKETLGPIHILVNNSGTSRLNTLIDGDAEKWKIVFDTNVFGLCYCTREAVRDMRKNNVNGHIIHINSILGHKIPSLPHINVYGASKFAVTALTETLRNEINQNQLKIKITSISPGIVDTEINDVAGFEKSEIEMIKSLATLKSEDVAEGVLYVLGTPPHVNVSELKLQPVGETIF